MLQKFNEFEPKHINETFAYDDLPEEFKGPLQRWSRHISFVETFTLKPTNSHYIYVTLTGASLGVEDILKFQSNMGLTSIEGSNNIRGGIVLTFPIRATLN